MPLYSPGKPPDKSIDQIRAAVSALQRRDILAARQRLDALAFIYGVRLVIAADMPRRVGAQ